MPNDVAETFVPGTVRDRLQSMMIPNLIGSQRDRATAVCQLASIHHTSRKGLVMDNKLQDCYEANEQRNNRPFPYPH